MIDHGIFAADDLKANTVQRAEGRTDGDDRNACENKEDINPEYIKEIRQKPHCRVVIVKSILVHYLNLKRQISFLGNVHTKIIPRKKIKRDNETFREENSKKRYQIEIQFARNVKKKVEAMVIMYL